ncbi:inactive ribonuclease-like protein 9 [Hippopotamus amphibius kiboko]|uniref:inactive ribonuclease-like protein 9 n=1 Tax=Hippopotamus amphibius kiboko TaxID=575201 RepID=UPI0025951010|nr:inactive ribonuclease-like protein 9 [Hippopotamus amphibius kiboko]
MSQWNIAPFLLYSLQENMGTLINTKALFLLFLLLKPLQFVGINDYNFSPEKQEEFEDYMEDLLSTGPTKPPSKDTFKKRVIIDAERPLTDPEYCTEEIRMKNVHNKLFCVKEHFFLLASYEDIQELCFHMFVQCSNGIRKCHRSWKVIEGVHCVLTSGDKMPSCKYESSRKEGFVLVTCRWQNDIGQIIPDSVNGIVTIKC